MLAQKNKINILEFSPREVKCSVTGFGGASKEQVAVMVHRLFPQFTDPVQADISDALAVALCTLWTQRSNASKRLF
jgi:crossover junction endodeoxyribonuclease RuvC